MTINWAGEVFLSRMNLLQGAQLVLIENEKKLEKLQMTPTEWWHRGKRREIRSLKRRVARCRAHCEALCALAEQAHAEWLVELHREIEKNS